MIRASGFAAPRIPIESPIPNPESLLQMRLGIKGKQVIGVTSIVGVVVVVLSLVHLANLARVSLEESRARAELLAYSIYHRAAAVVGDERHDPYKALREDPGLRSILESSLYSKNVTFAAIVDANGVAVVHADPAYEGHVLLTRRSAQHAAGQARVRGAGGDLFRAGTQPRVPAAAPPRQHGVRLDPHRRVDAPHPSGSRSARCAPPSRPRLPPSRSPSLSRCCSHSCSCGRFT